MPLLLLSPRSQWVKKWVMVDSPAKLIVGLIFHWCTDQHNSIGFENNGKNQQYQLLYIAMTSHKWIPIQRASNEECVFMSWWHHDQGFDNTPLACIYFEEVWQCMSIIHVCHALQFPDQFLAKGLEARWPFLCQFSLVSSRSSFFPPQSTRKGVEVCHHDDTLWYFQVFFSLSFLSDYRFSGLMQERRNSIANALELCLSCTNPLVCVCDLFAVFWPSSLFPPQSTRGGVEACHHDDTHSSQDAAHEAAAWEWNTSTNAACGGAATVPPPAAPDRVHPRPFLVRAKGSASTCTRGKHISWCTALNVEVSTFLDALLFNVEVSTFLDALL